MRTLTVASLRGKAEASTKYVMKSAAVLLSENVRAQVQSPAKTYDIFLSHSFRDADLILGLKLRLEEDFGHSVYVDWVAEPQLDRSNVTAATAQALRTSMNRCKGLLYASTENSTTSKWMPWECGYFDGKFGRSAIFPITDSPKTDYKGQEYLGVYPYIAEDIIKGQTKNVLWVTTAPNIYCTLGQWLSGVQPSLHP
jgi:hypothetical protein